MFAKQKAKQKMKAATANAVPFAHWLVNHYSKIIKAHLHGRGNLTRDDLEYVVLKCHGLKDPRMKDCISELVGWGDEERAEVETFFAIALEVMRTTPPSRLRAAAQLVEIKSLIKDL